MQSFINMRVLRNYVKISQPRVVENAEVLKTLYACPEFPDIKEDEKELVGVIADDAGADAVETAGIAVAATEAEAALEEKIAEQMALANAVAADIKIEAKREAKKEADLVLAEAKEKAAMILAEAEAGAKEIRIQAKAESERRYAEIAEQAKTEIYPKAREEGYEAGRQAGEEDGKAAYQDVSQVLRLAQRAMQEEYAKVDETLLHLAVKIAERLVRCSLYIEPQLLRGIIHALTLLPQERQGWVLHVAPGDAVWLEREQPPCPCPWVTDESLAAGDCYLECQEGFFDARLEAQLEKLEHALREELQHGTMDPVAGNS